MISSNYLLYLTIFLVCWYKCLDCTPLVSDVPATSVASGVEDKIDNSLSEIETQDNQLQNGELTDEKLPDSNLNTEKSPSSDSESVDNKEDSNIGTVDGTQNDKTDDKNEEVKEDKDDVTNEENEDAVVQHGDFSKNSAPMSQYNKDSDGRDDSSIILHYAVPVTVVALVVVCTALVIRCRTRREENRKKFGPGTEFHLTDIFKNEKRRMKGFHRLSTESDTEEQSDASVF
ncbi:uncharacterized protein LOC144443843 [Glandiceps talaboti]